MLIILAACGVKALFLSRRCLELPLVHLGELCVEDYVSAAPFDSQPPPANTRTPVRPGAGT